MSRLKSTGLRPTWNMWKLQLSLSGLLVLLFSVASAYAEQARYNGVASASVIHKLSKSNVVKLIDIRRPAEWRQTGVAQTAHQISMHQAGFADRVYALVGGDLNQPIALICARGNRSTWMKSQLNQLGFSNVTNVSEGMLGSQAGPGWLKRNLPTK